MSSWRRIGTYGRVNLDALPWITVSPANSAGKYAVIAYGVGTPTTERIYLTGYIFDSADAAGAVVDALILGDAVIE